MGMGGILVSGAEEVYELPGILTPPASFTPSTTEKDLLLETLIAFLA